MNLNISYNWLKEYVKTNESSKDFAKKISLSGPSVDYIHESKPDFTKVVVGEILELEKHPDADKLNVCKVNVGEKEPLNIVCGAPNIKQGQKVPVVLVGGTVSGFEVKKAKLRGVESSGMMCSQKELGIGEDHTGIFILPDYTKIGLPLEKVMPLEDSIFDMEVTSNRPDAMSIVGVAREASAILNDKFLYENPKPNLKQIKDHKLSVSVKESKLCPRYQAMVMTNIKVESSPLWMQQRLLSAGLRPINNLVDITNYVLLEFGQPMHVFDYDKLKGNEINVRMAKKGEQILALDGKNYELTADNLVIADSENPVAIAGVMGGEPTAATEETTTIVLESANFDPVSVRKTSRTLNLYSDSSNLFEKSLSPEGTTPALLRAIELVMELAGGKIASKMFDDKNYSAKPTEISLNPENVSKTLGVEIKPDQIKTILTALGFEIKSGKELKVKVPWWREKDIEGEHDLIEEIARIYGYHNLPSELPQGQIPVEVGSGKVFAKEEKAKDVLVSLGFTENYNYSFISEKLIKDCGLDTKDHVQISNPLNVDFEYMRTSLVPGMLQSIAENESFYKDINIFELSKIYEKIEGDLPREISNLAMARAGENKEELFFNLKGDLEKLLDRLHVENYQLEEDDAKGYWHQALKITIGDEIIGRIGVVDQEILYLYGIKLSASMVEIDFEKLMPHIQSSSSFTELPKYPGIDLDLSMEIEKDIPYQKIIDTIVNLKNEKIKNISFLSEYHGDKMDKDKKAIAIRITYRDDSKTLKLEDAQGAHKQVVKKLEKAYNIKVR